MATSPYGGFADLSSYRKAVDARMAANADPLSSLIQGFQQGQAIQQLPQKMAEDALNKQLALAIQQAKLQELQQGKPFEVGGSLVVRDPATGEYKTVFTAPAKETATIFQPVGVSTNPEGVTEGISFNPRTNQYVRTPLPAGVTSIAPKVTQPGKSFSTRTLTPNAQLSIINKASAAGIDPNDPKYLNEETNVYDYTKIAIDAGKAARENKRVENLVKAQGLTGKTKTDLDNLNAASKQLDSLQLELEEITNSGTAPGFGDNFISAITASEPQGVFATLTYMLAKASQGTVSKDLEAKKGIVSSGLRKAISGTAVSADEAKRLGWLPLPVDSFEDLVRKVSLVEEYVNNQRAGLSGEQSVPVVSPVATPGINSDAPSPVSPPLNSGNTFRIIR